MLSRRYSLIFLENLTKLWQGGASTAVAPAFTDLAKFGKSCVS